METKEFYKPIRSLVNLILTGEQEIATNTDQIIVCQQFIDSLSQYNSDNLYFLNQIEIFLGFCNNEERFCLLKFYLENEGFLIRKTISNRFTKKEMKLLNEKDLSELHNYLFFKFVNDGEVQPVVRFSMYFYVENISKINIVNGTVSRADYQNAIKFNSIKRDIKDVYDF